MGAITPEVIRNSNIQDDRPLNNINLTKVENKKVFNKYDYSRTVTNNTTITNESKGFFRFILDTVLFPITFPYKVIRYFILKYDLRGNIRKNNKHNYDYDKNKKMIKKIFKMQRFEDEIL